MGRSYDASSYTEVKDRLKWYKEDYPDYRVETEVLSWSENHDSVLVKAYLFKNVEEQEKRCPHSSGVAEELRGAGFVNKTSHVENAETSAIGRALANVDYTGSDKRPSKEEMDKVERTKKAQAKDNAQEKTAPKKEKTEKTSKEKSEDEIIDTIASFEDKNELVKWYNNEVPEDKRVEYQEYVIDRLNEIKS